MLASFRWVIQGRLAGSARPGLLGDAVQELGWLREHGFGTVVTLTEDPLRPPVEGFGLRGIHFPIPDMGFPVPQPTAALCAELVAASESAPILIHCKGGMGRTGLVLACCLVTLGRTAEEAVLGVRTVHPGYIQTGAQERFVHHLARHLEMRRAQEQSA